MELQASEAESRRFGLRVFRAACTSPQPQSLVRSMLQQRADLVILRMPAAALAARVGLEEMGLPVVVGDTLVHYEADLHGAPAAGLRNLDLDFAPADPGPLEDLVRAIFPDYVNHYRANPILPQETLLEGYVEWALGYAGGDPARAAWVARRGREPVAFATCRFAEEEADGVLYGVAPGESGRGIYRDLIRFTRARAQERGCRRMHVSTQVSNFAVQAVWVSEGFRLREAEVTLHLNALFDWGRRAPQRRDCIWSRRGLEAAGPWPARRLVDELAENFLGGKALGGRGLPFASLHLEVQPLRAGLRYEARCGVLGGVRSRLAVLRVADAAGEVAHQAYYQWAAGG